MSRKSEEEKKKLSRYFRCLDSIVSTNPSIDDLVLQVKDIAEEYCPKIHNLPRDKAKNILICLSIALILNKNILSLLRISDIKCISDAENAFDNASDFLLQRISLAVSDEAAKEAFAEYQAINNKNKGENNEDH